MSKKLTIEFVRESFAERGYTLLSTEYKDNRTKLLYICCNGHESEITFSNWAHGQRCAYCDGNAKYTYAHVKASFEELGYTLISTEYVNALSKLIYKCPLGHVGKINWNKWSMGRRCFECSKLNKFGATNSNWRGGITFEKYCEAWQDKEYKQGIIKRDGHRCLNPYCCSERSNKVVIHHINYNNKDCRPNNLITVCISCNSKANFDREWHTAWYQAILKQRYNYKY